ncbi:MAG: phosphomannomutase [Verrucomicrobia bacterium]|nr:phosphomannomutase [Verrucomicrobiota bacterium]
MTRTGVRFGTSGARGLAVELTDLVAYAYTRGFLQYLETVGSLTGQARAVAVAGDLRPSTDRIMAAVLRAATDLECRPVNCGKVPTPAVALYGLAQPIPAIMVTGSHIPADRNGIKFNKPTGEILKDDEAAIAQQVIEIEDGRFDQQGVFRQPTPAPTAVDPAARTLYLRRYLEGFPPDALRGLHLGLYEHSSVGRELFLELLRGLGANVTPLGRSDTFVPVDTEAIRDEDACLARAWAAEHRFHAILSADGDADRPLLSDEAGQWLRGDVLGILAARFLGADSVSVPVSCNTAVEKCGWFNEVRRTRIGSPYVIGSMIEAARSGARRVVGYEANGGFLTQSDLEVEGRRLRALPTRDAVLPLLAVLLLARREGATLAELVGALPARFTASGLLREFPRDRSQAVLGRFSTGDEQADRRALETLFGAECGRVASIDRTDGVRVVFENGEIVHLRPSGNAPEFRCYTEAASEDRAQTLDAWCLAALQRAVD